MFSWYVFFFDYSNHRRYGIRPHRFCIQSAKRGYLKTESAWANLTLR